MANTNKKKGGRPKLDDLCRRKHTVKTTLSDLEYENFMRDTLKSGLRPSEFLRRRIADTELKEALSCEDRKQFREFYKLGQLLSLIFKRTPPYYQEAYMEGHQKAMATINQLTDHYNSKL